jgi:hypothetical protein
MYMHGAVGSLAAWVSRPLPPPSPAPPLCQHYIQKISLLTNLYKVYVVTESCKHLTIGGWGGG